MYLYTSTGICTYTQEQAQVYIQAQVYALLHKHRYLYLYTRTSTSICTYTQTQIYVFIHKHRYVLVQGYTGLSRQNYRTHQSLNRCGHISMNVNVTASLIWEQHHTRLLRIRSRYDAKTRQCSTVLVGEHFQANANRVQCRPISMTCQPHPMSHINRRRYGAFERS